jgi:hypothetical protein
MTAEELLANLHRQWGEFLPKLRHIADGALNTIERRKEHQGQSNDFWRGYQQCADDVSDFWKKHGP